VERTKAETERKAREEVEHAKAEAEWKAREEAEHQALKRQQSVWVAAPSDEVHSTQELLEVRQGSQGLGRLEGIGRVEVFSHSRTELKHIQRKKGDCLVS